MKKLTFSIVVFLLPFLSKAQLITTKKNGGEKQTNYVFASAGVSVPQGHINLMVNASSGPIVALGYHSFFNKRWGMGLVVSGSMYKSEAVNEYSKYYGKFVYSTSPKGNWQKAQAYLTFSYTPILRKRWAIDIVQGFGLDYIRQPAYDYYNYYSYYRVDAKKDWSTGYNIALTGRILLKDNIGLLVSANFFHDLGLPSNVKPYNSVGAFDTVDWGLGIVYNLKK